MKPLTVMKILMQTTMKIHLVYIVFCLCFVGNLLQIRSISLRINTAHDDFFLILDNDTSNSDENTDADNNENTSGIYRVLSMFCRKFTTNQINFSEN